MTTPDPAFRVKRTIDIDAPPEVVFDFFRESDLFASWFGVGSRIEARVGGEVKIVFPGGALAIGEVLEVEAPRHIRFTWGYPREDGPVAPGGSVVDVHVEATGGGARLTLEHALPSEDAASAHDGGWAYHLSRLGAKSARVKYGQIARDVLSAWFDAWAADGDDCASLLAKAMSEDGYYQDDAVTAPSRAEVAAHIGRCHAQMPGSRLVRVGPVLHTGNRLACRAALEGRGSVLGHALITFEMNVAGHIERAFGLFEDPIPGVSDGPLLPA